MNWTRLSCHEFKDNEVRLQLFALAYNLGNFLRRLALPRRVKHWSLTTLREKLIKIGAKIVRHARYVFFQMAEVAVPRELFAAILERIVRLRPLYGHRVGLHSAAEFSKAGRGGSGTVLADRHSPFVVRQIAVQGSRWLII